MVSQRFRRESEVDMTHKHCMCSKGCCQCGETTIRWGHALEAKPEKWEGAYKTRDEAIDAGRAFHKGSQFYIQRGALAWGPEYMPDAEAIETMLWDAAYTDVDEAAEGFPDITPEAKAELDAFLTAWAEKHVKAKFWLADDSPPILYTAVGQLKLDPST